MRKFWKSICPIACFLAKLKSDVTAVIPNFSYSKYILSNVGIVPINIPIKKIDLKIDDFLNKWYERNGARPIRGTKAI